MYSHYRKQVWSISLVEAFSILILVAGIIVLAVGTNDKCDSYCIEKSCTGINGKIYPCNCGSTCQTKTVVVDSVYRLGVAFLIMGIVGSIIGCILLCVYRRRYYYYNQPPVVSGGGAIIIQQGPAMPGFQTGQPVYQTGQPYYPPGQPGYQPGQPGYQPGQPGFPPGQPVYQIGQPVYGYAMQGEMPYTDSQIQQGQYPVGEIQQGQPYNPAYPQVNQK